MRTSCGNSPWKFSEPKSTRQPLPLFLPPPRPRTSFTFHVTLTTPADGPGRAHVTPVRAVSGSSDENGSRLTAHGSIVEFGSLSARIHEVVVRRTKRFYDATDWRAHVLLRVINGRSLIKYEDFVTRRRPKRTNAAHENIMRPYENRLIAKIVRHRSLCRCGGNGVRFTGAEHGGTSYCVKLLFCQPT